MDSLKQRTVAGTRWTFLGRLLTQVGAFALSALVARLLTPADFGLIGMSATFTGFAGLFAEMGFGAALVQAKELDESHRSSIFWLNVAAGVMLSLLSLVAAPILAYFFHEPRLLHVVAVIGLSFFFGGLGVAQRALLMRDMRFRAIATIEVVAEWTGGVAAVVAAYADFGVWSLVVQATLRTICATGCLWWVSAWRPRWCFSRASVRELFGFSANLLGFNVFNYWTRNIDNLLIGRFFGSAALGLYTRAYTIMLLPVTQFTGMLGNVLFPTFSRIQDDTERIRRAYLRTIAMIALVSFPAMFGLAACAPDFVLALYGPNWGRTVPLVELLAPLGALQSIASTVGWLFRSQGRTDLLLRWGLFAGGVVFVSVALGVWLGGVNSVALCYAIGGCLLFFLTFELPGRLIGMTLRHVLAALWRPVLGAGLMAVIVKLVSVWAKSLPLVWLRLGLEIGVGVVTYALLMAWLSPASLGELRSLLGRGRPVSSPRGPA